MISCFSYKLMCISCLLWNACLDPLLIPLVYKSTLQNLYLCLSMSVRRKLNILPEPLVVWLAACRLPILVCHWVQLGQPSQTFYHLFVGLRGALMGCHFLWYYGRLTVVNSLLSSLPMYWLSTLRFPESVIKQIYFFARIVCGKVMLFISKEDVWFLGLRPVNPKRKGALVFWI